jgi:hypothetical protein
MAMWIRSSSLVIALVMATACGSQASPHSGPSSPASDPAALPRMQVLRLEPGHYTYRLGRDVRIGEAIRCFTPSGKPAGGGGVEPRGRGVGSSTGFVAMTSPDGRVQVTCPAQPGNA